MQREGSFYHWWKSSLGDSVGQEMLIMEWHGIVAVWWASLRGKPVDRWSEGKMGAAPRRNAVGSRISDGKRDAANCLHVSRGPETCRSPKVATFPFYFAVL